MKEIMCNRDYFVMYPLFNFEPVKEFKCMRNVGMFRGVDDSAGKCSLNLMKVLYLHERKSLVKRVIVCKTRMNEESGNSSKSGKVNSVTDTTEVTNVVMTGARKGGNLFGKR